MSDGGIGEKPVGRHLGESDHRVVRPPRDITQTGFGQPGFYFSLIDHVFDLFGWRHRHQALREFQDLIGKRSLGGVGGGAWRLVDFFACHNSFPVDQY